MVTHIGHSFSSSSAYSGVSSSATYSFSSIPSPSSSPLLLPLLLFFLLILLIFSFFNLTHLSVPNRHHRLSGDSLQYSWLRTGKIVSDTAGESNSNHRRFTFMIWLFFLFLFCFSFFCEFMNDSSDCHKKKLTTRIDKYLSPLLVISNGGVMKVDFCSNQ